MFKFKKDTNYISELDLFLKEFDRQNPTLSTSQQEEIAKALRVAKLRDNPQAEVTKDLFDF